MNQYHLNSKCHGQPTASRRHRHGLSLLEVILSIAILAMALVAIGELISTGFRSASASRLNSEAQMLCDTKMAEVASGVLPLESAAGNSIEESVDWEYDVEIDNAEVPGLLVVKVIVRQVSASNPIEFYVTRFLPDPDFDPSAE